MNTSLPLRNKSTQFINIKPLNPLISSCDVKVLYHGKNRNRSLISRGVAEKIAATLPNTPIIGEYLDYKGDFGDHAQEMVINDEGVKTVKRTRPYGVVPADTKVWWQWFIDEDGVEREYLMCKGYLWTGRYPEVLRVLEEGNGQSMEFDANTMEGIWAIPENEEDEYFIVSDATFVGLCILGEDVEPCFEGANIGPEIIYSLDKDKFKSKMNQFMLDLKEALNSEKGGTKMPEDNTNIIDNNVNVINEPILVVDPIVEPVMEPIVEPIEDGQAVENLPSENEETSVETSEVSEEAYAKKDKKKEDEEDESETETEADPKEGEEEEEEDDEDKKKKGNKYNLEEVMEYQELKSEYAVLEEKYTALVSELEGIKPELSSLREMKSAADVKAKENMIGRFYMLEEEDIKEVKENMNNYSLEDIEAKLSVIAVRKKVNFNLDETGKNESNTEEPIVSYSTQIIDNTPAWLKVVDEIKNRI